MVRFAIRPGRGRAGIPGRTAREGRYDSTRVARLALLEEPPNAEAHELSDKGGVNQALAKQRRAGAVERLYAETPGPDILVL